MDFLRKIFGVGKTSSAIDAKERLRIVLMHDRTDISPQLMNNLRLDIIAVLRKYMDIDENKIEMDLDQDGPSVALVANIPVLQVKRMAQDTMMESNAVGGKTIPRNDLLRNNGVRAKRHR